MKYILLQPQDRVATDGVALEILSVRQQQTPREHSDVVTTFKDGSAALVGRTEVSVSRFRSTPATTLKFTTVEKT